MVSPKSFAVDMLPAFGLQSRPERVPRLAIPKLLSRPALALCLAVCLALRLASALYFTPLFGSSSRRMARCYCWSFLSLPGSRPGRSTGSRCKLALFAVGERASGWRLLLPRRQRGCWCSCGGSVGASLLLWRWWLCSVGLLSGCHGYYILRGRASTLLAALVTHLASNVLSLVRHSALVAGPMVFVLWRVPCGRSHFGGSCSESCVRTRFSCRCSFLCARGLRYGHLRRRLPLLLTVRALRPGAFRRLPRVRLQEHHELLQAGLVEAPRINLFAS